MKNIYTIGVYNSTEEQFFDKLIKNKIDAFCDLRRRRGVRGAKYSFVNSLRLQRKLEELKINYFHFLELSPTNEIRDKQKEDDKQKKIKKRDRVFLGEVFSNLYIVEHLTNENILSFEKKILDEKALNIALFCVEDDHRACHRSLLANHLNRRNPNNKIVNL